METIATASAKKGYCVWADCISRVYQLVQAPSPQDAHRIASENPDGWEWCCDAGDNEYVLSDEVMDDATKRTVFSLIESFQEGDKLDLRSGQRITLDSGKIPVEPSGLAGIKARLAMAGLAQFEIERGSSDYKVHLRTGLHGKANLDAVIGEKFGFGDNFELSYEASAGVEGGGSRLTGVTLTFKGDADGCKALVDLVGKMVDGEKVTRKDWQDATDVGATTEGRTKFALNAGAIGRTLVGGKGPEVSKTKDTLGAGVSASVSAQLARGTKDVSTESTKETTLKGEVEYSATLGANLAVYARLYNPLNMGTGAGAQYSGAQSGAGVLGMNPGKDGVSGTSDDKPWYNITDNVSNMDLVNLGASVTASYVDKWKQVTDGSGYYTKCETVRQANLRQGVIEAFAVCDTPEMQKVLKAPGNEEFAKNFEAFMKLATGKDFIAVTYGLTPEKLAEANELVRRGTAARRQGDAHTAEVFDRLARNIVDNNDNYIPTKIGLVTTSIQSGEITNLNARWIRWDTFSDGKSEHTGATLNIPPPPK